MQMPDRSTMPALKEVGWMNFPAITSDALPSGIPVYIIPFGQQEVVEVQILFSGGKFLEQISGQSSFASGMLTEGTRHLNSKAFAEKTDFYGASIQAEAGLDANKVVLTTLLKHLEPTLELLREATFFPRMNKEDFDLLCNRRIQSLEVDEKQTAFVARREFNRLMFGNHHPYGSFCGIPEVNTLSIEQVKAFHALQYNPANCAIIVSGKINADKVLALLSKVFASDNLPTPSKSEITNISKTDFSGGYHFFSMPESQQATIRAGHPAFTRLNPDYYPMQVVNTIFGGYFGSRLMKSIREEKGYTYGIGSGWITLRETGMFIIQTDCANEYIENVRTEIRKELLLLIEKGVEEKELFIVKNYILGTATSSRETPSRIADIVADALTLDLPFDRLDEKFEAVKSMTPAKVKLMAEKYLHPDNLMEVVCGSLK